MVVLWMFLFIFNEFDVQQFTTQWSKFFLWYWNYILILNFELLQEYSGPGGSEQTVEKPAKDEFKIAKWIKNNVPTKKTKFLNHNVEYFTGNLFELS